MAQEDIKWLSDPVQIQILASALRGDILDSLMVSGPLSVSDLAHELARPADSLYYHIHKMLDAGILEKHSVRKTIRRDEILYHVAAGRVRIRYDLKNAEIREMVGKAVGSMLRVTKRDFDRGLTSENAVTTGPSRNIRGSRFKAWLSREEIAKINEHMKSVVQILLSSRRAHDRRLHAFTYVLTPLEERPARRN